MEKNNRKNIQGALSLHGGIRLSFGYNKKLLLQPLGEALGALKVFITSGVYKLNFCDFWS